MWGTPASGLHLREVGDGRADVGWFAGPVIAASVDQMQLVIRPEQSTVFDGIAFPCGIVVDVLSDAVSVNAVRPEHEVDTVSRLIGVQEVVGVGNDPGYLASAEIAVIEDLMLHKSPSASPVRRMRDGGERLVPAQFRPRVHVPLAPIAENRRIADVAADRREHLAVGRPRLPIR